MTQDEIIRMAREAGFSIKTINSIDGDEIFWFTNITEMLERFAALVAANRDAWWIEQMQGKEDRVRADEREACAKVCEDKHDYMCSRAAAAIRARGNDK